LRSLVRLKPFITKGAGVPAFSRTKARHLREAESNTYARVMAQADAVVVGSGPNGLTAAIVIARTGRKVIVFEAADTIGGGCRSAELTLPGFIHDICSAVHPFAIASPAFRSIPLAQYGLEWIEPATMLAHPLDGGDVGLTFRSLSKTADAMGADADAYRDVYGPIVDDWSRIEMSVLGPFRLPSHPLSLARFGLRALQAAKPFATRVFSTDAARATFAGIAAHSMMPLDTHLTAGVALVLGAMAHVAGWAIPRGGAQRIADALAAHLRSLGGEIVAGTPVTSIDDLPPSKAILCDLSPRPLLRIAGHRFPSGYRAALERYRYGIGVFKVDWALDGPIPWRNPACASAGTVHLGGSLEEIAASEREVSEGHDSPSPFVLLSQPTVVDPSRAPIGRHVVWTYCHVPHGSRVDMLPRIERQIERFAPGFRDRVLARSVMTPADIERHNPNFVGGDIAAGVNDVRQFFTRPTWRTYSTPVRGLYICSASTPPGVGVHGMCGYFSAQRALNEVLRE
jgi:phytoene dehydrogenase-like protein